MLNKKFQPWIKSIFVFFNIAGSGILSWSEMHARNEHASQIPALAEIPVGLKIMPQNTPTVWRYTHVRCYLNVHINWLVTVFPLVKERESRSSLGFSATILIHVRCSIWHPSIPLTNGLKRLTDRRGVRIAEKTQIHRIDWKRLALHVNT